METVTRKLRLASPTMDEISLDSCLYSQGIFQCNLVDAQVNGFAKFSVLVLCKFSFCKWWD